MYMKYIKLFENINNDGYEKIDHDTYKSLAYQYEFESFIEKEINCLRKIGFKYDKDRTYGMRNNNDIYVFKMGDSWYVVYDANIRNGVHGMIYGPQFKCDQWDSVINCLKNEFNIG